MEHPNSTVRGRKSPRGSRFILEHDFTIVAVEADWPDAGFPGCDYVLLCRYLTPFTAVPKDREHGSSGEQSQIIRWRHIVTYDLCALTYVKALLKVI